MSDAPDVHAVIGKLSAGKAIRCKEMEWLLISLGFSVRNGKKQGHRVITHSELAGFTSAAFSCGHGRNPTVKPVYVRQMLKMLKLHSDDLNLLCADKRKQSQMVIERPGNGKTCSENLQ